MSDAPTLSEPELDYAFLAKFADVERGVLTAVGASFTHMTVPVVPSNHLVGVAGRIRAPEAFKSLQLGITISAPDDVYSLSVGGPLTRPDDVLPYDGKLGLLFAMMVGVGVVAEGLYTFTISLDGTVVRVLRFRAQLPPAT